MIPVEIILLTLFAGVICKVYDDFNDNDLYSVFHISHKNYINEMLKAIHYLAFTVISLKYTLFYVLFMITLSANIFFDEKAFSNPYEFSGFVSGFLLLFFINYSQLFMNYCDVFFFIFLMAGVILVDFGSKIKIEYSEEKLYQRSLGLLFFIIVLFAHYQYSFFTESVIVSMMYVVGYLVASCIFHLILLRNQERLAVKSN
jgi:hypothetical protein